MLRFRNTGPVLVAMFSLSLGTASAENCGDLLQGYNVPGVYIYDITKDSTDHATWYDDGGTSWRNEAGPFPLKSYLIVTGQGLDVIDLATNTLWMRFDAGPNNALPASGHHTVKALDGVVWVGCDTGLYQIDFIQDVIRRTDTLGVASYTGTIAQRNGGLGYGTAGGTGIVHAAVNDIALTTGHVFLGTDGGVSLIDLSSGGVRDDLGEPVAAVEMESGDLIYHDGDELLRRRGLPGADFVADDSLYLNGINDIVADQNAIYVGVEGGGVVTVNGATFTVSQQMVKSTFDQTQPYFWNTMERVSGNVLISEIGTNLTLSGSSLLC